MASFKLPLLVLFVEVLSMVSSQNHVKGFFNAPATRFNRGGRINFRGLSLGKVCKQIMMMGGKEALSDGMGAASKWFSTQKIAPIQAGGTDPQMQCLFAYATGSVTPGMTGTKDPGNMFGDYFDTIIEYPVLDPCATPQCDGQVNPLILLRRKFGRMMGMGRPGMGGMMGGMMGGLMGGMMGGAKTGQHRQNPMVAQTGASNTMSNNPFSKRLQQQQQPQQPKLLFQQQHLLQQQQQKQHQSPMGPSQMQGANNNMLQAPQPGQMSNPMTGQATAQPTTILPSGHTAATATTAMGGNNNNVLAMMMQNPKIVELFQQFIMMYLMKSNMGQSNPMNSGMPGMARPNPMMQSVRPPMGGFGGGNPPMNGGFSPFFQ